MKLTYLSNIIYSKGIVHLLNAVVRFNENLDSSDQIELMVYGRLMPDEYMNAKRLEKEISAFRIHQFISINPPVGRSEVSTVLKESDIFVLPTFYRSEAFPVSVLEAMRFSCKILLTNHNNLPDIFSDYNIIWVEKRSIQSIISGLKEAINLDKNLVEENRCKVSLENSLSAFKCDVNKLMIDLFDV